MITKDMYESSLKIVENYKIQQEKEDRIKNRNICSKCGCSEDKWENGYNIMKLDVQTAYNVEGYMFDEIYNYRHERHPAIKNFDNGILFEIKKDSDYRLCEKCYYKLLKLIGDYINTTTK